MLVGAGLIEQMQKYGYLEYRLTVQNQGKSLHFRNIGWTGDTPAGIARDGLGTRQAGHEPANEGWLQLQKQIAEIKPSVAIIGYGMASSLDGSSLEKFKADYQTLIAHIKANAQKKNPLRLVFWPPSRTKIWEASCQMARNTTSHWKSTVRSSAIWPRSTTPGLSICTGF